MYLSHRTERDHQRIKYWGIPVLKSWRGDPNRPNSYIQLNSVLISMSTGIMSKESKAVEKKYNKLNYK